MDFKIGDKLFKKNNLYEFIYSIYENRESIHFIYSDIYKCKNNYFIQIGDNFYRLNRIKLKPKDLKNLSWDNYWKDILKQQDKTLLHKYCKRNWSQTDQKVNKEKIEYVNINDVSFEHFIKFFVYYSIFYLHKL